jgi:hypothetical protein
MLVKLPRRLFCRIKLTEFNPGLCHGNVKSLSLNSPSA